MNKYNYELYSSHKSEHNNFVVKMLKAQNEFEKGRVNLDFELFDFLKDSLIKHILATDKKLGIFLNEKGVY